MNKDIGIPPLYLFKQNILTQQINENVHIFICNQPNLIQI